MPAARALPAAMAAQAVLVVSPVATIDGLTGTPRAIGAQVARADIATTVTASLPLLLALLPIVLVTVAVGTRRRSAAARRAAVALSSISVLFAVVPPLRAMTFAATTLYGVPLALAGAAGVALALREPRMPAPRSTSSRRPRLVFAALTAALVAQGVVGATSSTIPSGLASTLLASDLEFHSATPTAAFDVAEPAQNPHLAPNPGNNIHGDAAMSDAYRDRPLIDPRSAEVISRHLGGVCASVLFDSRGRVIAVCVQPTGVVLNVLDPDSLEVLARRHVADRPFRIDFATNFSGGGYAVLDNADRVVLPTADGRITRWSVAAADGAPEITLVDEFDVSSALADGEAINSAVPDATGPLWIVGRDATVAVLDFSTGEVHATRFKGADIENSLAVGKDGGAYVVSSAALYRMEIVDGAPRVVWEQTYDRGTRKKPGQTSRASGTTPTLFEDESYVAITDNADPRMHVVVYRTDPDIPAAEREVCRVPVFRAAASATDNSLIAMGRSLFVENNYGYNLFTSTNGRTSTPGLARIDVAEDGSGCSQVWSNDEISIPSVVSKGLAVGAIVSYSKEASTAGIDAWYFTAIDATTGELMWRRLAGTGVMFNNHYAATYVGADGTIYTGVLGGLVALRPRT